MAPLKQRRVRPAASPRAMTDQGTNAPTAATVDSDDHAGSLARFLNETFPEKEYGRSADTYGGEALPRSSGGESLDYKASNFATLAVRTRNAAHNSGKRGDGKQMAAVELAATASHSSTRTPLIPKPSAIVTALPTSKTQRRKLDFSLYSVEGMTRYGSCFVFGGPYRLLGDEETHAVLLKLQEILALEGSLARKKMSKVETERGQELMREKVRFLWEENLLMAFGGTVVPCDQRGDPFVGTNKYVQGALEALFEFLSSDDNEWVHEHPVKRMRDPHVWTRNVYDKTAVVKIKRRSQIIWVGCGDADLVGFHGTVDSRFEKSKKTKHVTDECMRVLNKVRADRARRIAQHREQGTEAVEEPMSTSGTTYNMRTRGQRSPAFHPVDRAGLPSKRLRHDDKNEVPNSDGLAVGSALPKRTPKLLLKGRKPSNSQVMSSSPSPPPRAKQRIITRTPVAIPATAAGSQLSGGHIDANTVDSPVSTRPRFTMAITAPFSRAEIMLLALYYELKYIRKSRTVTRQIKERLELDIAESTIRVRVHKLLKRGESPRNLASEAHRHVLETQPSSTLLVAV